MQQFDQYVKLNKKIPPEILTSIASIDDPGRLADTIAAHLPLKLESKQTVLGLSVVKERLENLFEQIEHEVDILNVDKKIRGRVKRQMEKNQRDFYLNEQVKAIQKELGEGEPLNARKPRNSVAIIAPTQDSSESAFMPPTSPTLSPTLSAIVAGFL